MRSLIVAAVLCLIPVFAVAEPWYMSGQTNLASGQGVINPTPSRLEAVGVVDSLPYVVPANHRLCIETMAMEAYDAPGIAVLFVFTGTNLTPPFNPIASGSVGASNGSTEFTGRICFDEFTHVNVRLLNGQAIPLPMVYGWQITGELLDVPQ